MIKSDEAKGDAAPQDDAEFTAPVWARSEPRVGGATDVGVVREVNQDAFGRFDDTERSEILLVVADGLGGHRGGEVASQMAVDRLGEFVLASGDAPEARLHQGILEANKAILSESRRDVALDGMGTTIVCLLLAEEGPSYAAHVGDSRLYRSRAGRLTALTEDHSLVATLVREGVLTEAEARTDPRRNQILRALGVRDDLEVDVAPVELAAGDIYLLCSDGLHGMIDDEELEQRIARVTRPARAAEELIEAANQAGGTDNITCLLACVPDPMPIANAPSVASRLFESTRSVFSRRDASSISDDAEDE